MTKGGVRRFAGILWMVAASACYAVMAALTKAAIDDVDVFTIVFWRSVIVALVALGAARVSGCSLLPGAWKLLGIRSVLGLAAMLLYFWSLGQVSLGTATTLLYTAPLFTVLFAGPLLGEVPNRRVLPLALLAFGGVALIIGPTTLELNLGSLASLAAGLFAGLAYVTVRKLRTTDPPSRIVFFFAIVCMLLSAPFAVHNGLPGTWSQAGALGGIGVFAGLGQLTMTHAYRIEKAHVAGPFSYAQIVFAFGLGALFWGERLGVLEAIGVLLIVTVGAFLSGMAGRVTPKANEPPTAEKCPPE